MSCTPSRWPRRWRTAGQDVTVWTLGRGGDARFFRDVDPRVRLAIVPFVDRDGEGTGPRIVRSIEVLRGAFADRSAV